MASSLFLKKLKVPVGTKLPKDVDGWLAIMEQFMSIQSQFTNGGAIETVCSETKPTDTTVLWVAINASGQALGSFKFFGGLWLSTSFKKGEDIHSFEGALGSVHPHWRLCDPAVSGATVNGVTIPDMTGAMQVMATTGGKYAIGDTGGADDRALTEANMFPHVHEKGTLTGLATEGAKNEHGHKTPRGDSTTGVVVIEKGSSGDLLANVPTVPNDPNSRHEHDVDIEGETASFGAGEAFDNRSKFYAVGYKIYVGIE